MLFFSRAEHMWRSTDKADQCVTFWCFQKSMQTFWYVFLKKWICFLEIRLTQGAMIQAKISPLEFLVSQTWRLTEEKVTRYYLREQNRETTRWNNIIFKYYIKTKFMLISPYRYIFPQISTTLCLKQVHPLWSPKGFSQELASQSPKQAEISTV